MLGIHVRRGFKYTGARYGGNFDFPKDRSQAIYQFKGERDTKNPKLIPYQDHVLKLTAEFTNIIFSHVLKKGNQMTDAPTTISSIFKVTWSNHEPCITNRHNQDPTLSLAIKEETNDKSWF